MACTKQHENWPFNTIGPLCVYVCGRYGVAENANRIMEINWKAVIMVKSILFFILCVELIMTPSRVSLIHVKYAIETISSHRVNEWMNENDEHSQRSSQLTILGVRGRGTRCRLHCINVENINQRIERVWSTRSDYELDINDALLYITDTDALLDAAKAVIAFINNLKNFINAMRREGREDRINR